MARFDVYANLGKSKKTAPYLVDVQSNVISGLATRIVIPLRNLNAYKNVEAPGDLFPLIAVNGKKYLLDTPQLAAIPMIELTEKIGSAAAFQPAILDALDRVFGAY
ncbi:CcdB family protein [Undibacterium seohonense]|uniref:Toxin CcdB n=1 Tax=Undibacterium seohonense TaxID=1344950 RepID=A0ABR6X4W6_9BURK|nr:CcdB family protein [Undibacterium seohonense]MBC3807885.1 CcdB family protein [Undibacterium seohonense]